MRYIFKDFSDKTLNLQLDEQKNKHDQMGSLVECMLDLRKQITEAKIPQVKTMLQRQIEATDRQIDNLVYELYGLSEDEIRIVEGG